jgi:large subunit ribosomal protein L21
MKLIIFESMYAIIDFNGSQYKVEKDSKLYVNRLETPEGETFEIERVLLVDNDGDVKVGTPVVKDAKVSAKVLQHLKGDKVIVFKKKRRKGYKVKNGHRQYLTQIQIEDIVA